MEVYQRMKKVSILFMILLGICTCFGASVYAETGSIGELEYIYKITPSRNFIFNENPKVEVQTYLPNTAISNYSLNLYVDDVLTDIVIIKKTGNSVLSRTYEFPIYDEGEHTVKIEFLKDGASSSDAVNSICEKSFKYIQSIEKGYNQRGFSTHWGNSETIYDSYDFQFYTAIGADVVRDDIHWGMVETSKGLYSFEVYDNRLAAIISSDLNPMFVLSGTNPLYVNNTITRDSISKTNKDGTVRTDAQIDAEWEKQKLLIRTDAQIEAYSNFVLKTAKHYPNVKKFEIINEPGFSYTGAEYSKIVLAVSKKLKEYNPEIEVYVGSLIDNEDGVEARVDFAKNFFTPEIYPYVDAMSFHIYTANKYAENSKFDTQTSDYINEIKTEGGWKSLTVTEMGWPVGTWAKVSAEKQASELVKRTIMSDGLNLDFVTLYEFKNSGTDPDDYEQMLGIITRDRNPNPAYYAMQEYFRTTGRAQFIGKAFLANGMKAYAYASNGDNFVIVWAENFMLDLDIEKDMYKNVRYTFSDDVTITDMYGIKQAGKTVNPTYAPMYVHGLSKDSILNFVGAYGTGDVLGDTKSLLKETEYSQLIQLYNAIISEKNYDSVVEFVNYCYDLGESSMVRYRTGEMSITEYSYLLSELNDAAEFGARFVSVCDMTDVYAPTDEFMTEYNRISDIINISDRVGVRYLSEPYEEIRDILKKIKKYEPTTKINPISGENYYVSEDGKLTVSGTAGEKCNIVSVKILKEENIEYLTTFDTSTDKDYSAGYTLSDFGTYTLEIFDGEKKTEEIVYQPNGYVSVESKTTSLETLRSERLLKWSKLLMADYLETQKGYILPIEYTKEDGTIVLDYSDTEYEVFVAVFDANGLLSISGKNDEGNCVVDVSGGSDYIIKVYVWDGMVPKSTVIEY